MMPLSSFILASKRLGLLHSWTIIGLVAAWLLALAPSSAHAQVVQAVDDFYFGTEGFTVSFQILNNDLGPIDTTTLEIVEDPVNGTAIANLVTGRISFTPTGDANGFDALRYAVGDGINPPDTALVTVLVYPVNDPPEVVRDTDSTLSGFDLFIRVAENDSDPLDPVGNIDPFTLSIVTAPLHGTATPTGGALGRVHYIPSPGFVGLDSFQYNICDDGNPLPANCGSAWVVVSVLEPVQAGPDTEVCLGDSVQLTATGDGNFTWSPASGLSCTDCASPWASPAATTTYTVTSDGGGCCPNSADVTVTVNLAGSATANDDAFGLAEDGTRSFNVLGNDVLSDSFDVVLVQSTAFGTLDFPGSGAGLYTPNPDYSGTDTARYAICPRGCPAPCDTAWILFNVLPSNDAPIAIDDAEVTNEDVPLTFQALTNDTDPDGGIDSTSVLILDPPLHGSLVLDPISGAMTYTPDPDFFGSDSLRYRICDTGTPLPALCDEAVVVITVLPVVDPPVANADSDVLLEDGVSTIDVLANDTDADGSLGAVTVSIATAPSQGGAVVDPATGIMTYTPDPDFFGLDSLLYLVCDDEPIPGCDSAWVRYDVLPVNDAPIAINDVALTNEDSPVTAPVSPNDTDVDGTPVPSSVTVLGSPVNGNASANPDGSITYTPDPDFFGTDSVAYVICDDGFPLPAACDTGLLIILVTPVNDAIVAADDAFSVWEDSAATLDVLANDTDLDGVADFASVTLLTPPANGTASVDPATGLIQYTPDPDYAGPDVLVYRVCDDGIPPGCDSATVSINVLPVNDPPSAEADAISTPEDTPVAINVLANDTDIDGSPDPTTVTIITGPTQGSVVVNPVSGMIGYTPDLDAFGIDSFAYAVCDDGTPLPPACDTAWVLINITPINDPPLSIDDAASTLEDNPVVIDILANDSDPDGTPDPAGLSILAGPANGSIVLDPLTGEVTYTPALNYYGSDSFHYLLCDAGAPPACDSAWVVVTVLPVNDPPQAVNDAAATPEDTPVILDLDANDTDVDGTPDPATIGLVTSPANGSLVLDPLTGSVLYTPDLDFSGIDSFAYVICDDGFPLPVACDTGWAFIAVASFNDSLVAAADVFSVWEDSLSNLDVLANDVDPDGLADPASVVVLVDPVHGSATVDPVDGSINYQPDANYFGADSLLYGVCDDGIPATCDSAWVILDVLPINDAPLAANDIALTAEDTPVDADVLANDTDIDGSPDASSVSLVGGPYAGTASVNPDGSITYTPGLDFFGTDSLFYRVCDDGFPLPSQCDTARLIILVSPENDAPIANNDAVSLLEDSSLLFSPLSNDTDSESLLDTAGVTWLSTPAHGSLVWDPVAGEALYIPDPDFYGLDSATYQVCDGGLPPACDSALIVFTVNPVNDGMVANNDTVSTAEDTPLAFFPTINDTDIDGSPDPASLSILTAPSGGSAVVDAASGTITYTPSSGFIGWDSLAYIVCDDGTPLPGLCDTAWVFIDVFVIPPFNAAPIIVNDTSLVWEDIPAILTILANDSDPDGFLVPATLSIWAPPANGTATPDLLTGVVTYTGALDYYGPDSFAYRICDDGFGPACDSAWVMLTVQPINDPPIADADTMNTLEGVPVNIDVLTGDTDVDGSIDPATVTVVIPPLHGGTSILVGPGSVIYTPDPSFFGLDSFAYAVCDDGFPLPSECDTAWVLVNVIEIPNTPPNAVDDLLVLWEDSTATLNPLANDTDPDGTLMPASWAEVTAPVHGSALFDPVSSALSYTPNPNFYGLDSLAYAICDNHLPPGCDTAWVVFVVQPVNDPPMAGDDGALTSLDTPIGISVLDNDSDVDGSIDAASLSLVVAPSSGSVSYSPATGVVTYTPNPGFTGQDTFRYAVCDDGFPLPAECDTAWVVVAVGTGVLPNLPPLAVTDSLRVWEDSTAYVSVLMNDTDPEGLLDSATISLVSLPTQGSVTLLATTMGRLLDYTPAPDYYGTDSMSYRICDAGIPVRCDTGWVYIDVLPVNDPIVARNDSAISLLGVPVVLSPLANDVDIDGSADPFTWHVLEGPANGVAEFDTLSGTLTYTPDVGYSGLDRLHYAICDDGFPTPPGCDSAWVFWDVVLDPPGNDAPTAMDDLLTVWEDSTAAVDVLANDSDPENALDTASVLILAGPFNGTAIVLADGSVEYTGALNYHGPDSLQYSICDTGLPVLCDTAWVRITVLPVADAPVAMDDPIGVSFGLTAEWNPLNNDSDVDGDLDSNSVMLTWPPMNGSLSGAGNTWTYEPDAGWCGADSFQYSVCDATGLCDSAWVLVSVACDSFYAVDDIASIGLNATITLEILANDAPAADAACIAILDGPDHGTAIVSPNGELEYRVNEGFWGQDTLRYRVCDSSGLRSAEAKIIITVLYDQLFVPDGLSPNGDGRNDRFQILGLQDFPNNELVIINRWGDELFREAPYQGGWDGTYRGRDLPEGTYFYILQWDPNDPNARVTGPVTIRR